MDHLNNFRERVEALKRRTQMVEQRPCWWRHPASGVVMLLGALGVALGSVAPVHAQDIPCGAVLGPGGRFVLERDLVCGFMGSTPAVTLRDGAILDLNGHYVAIAAPSLRCVVLTGAGTQLLNGAVFGQLENIVLEGKGGHTVRHVTSGAQELAIVVRSDENRLVDVVAHSNGFNSAIVIDGHRNRLTDSQADCFAAFGGCIEVSGQWNRLIDNVATSTYRSDGFFISGHHNVLRGNQANEHDGGGIVVTGTGNSLTHNTALHNSTDLIDLHEDCDDNRWRQNVFETSRAGTTENPACMQPPSLAAHDVGQLP
jgi:parallel beta-helix repeat protein